MARAIFVWGMTCLFIVLTWQDHVVHILQVGVRNAFLEGHQNHRTVTRHVRQLLL